MNDDSSCLVVPIRRTTTLKHPHLGACFAINNAVNMIRKCFSGVNPQIRELTSYGDVFFKRVTICDRLTYGTYIVVMYPYAAITLSNEVGMRSSNFKVLNRSYRACRPMRQPLYTSDDDAKERENGRQSGPWAGARKYLCSQAQTVGRHRTPEETATLTMRMFGLMVQQQP